MGDNFKSMRESNAIRLLVPIKSLTCGETVQDILFANKELPFEKVTFLHVIENDLLTDPAYTSMEAISRLSEQDQCILEARAFLEELSARVSTFLRAEIASDAVVAADIAKCIINQAEQNNCNLAILLADTSSFNEGWFSTSVLKTVLKKAPLDLRVHVIRPAEQEGLRFGIKLR